jgi:hypothetical protein
MRAVEPVLSTDDSGEFEWRCSYQIEIAEVDHWLTALDAGYNFKDNDKKRAITYGDLPNPPDDQQDKDERVQDPIALNGSGGILAVDADPIFGRYRTRPYTNWNNGLDLIRQKVRG